MSAQTLNEEQSRAIHRVLDKLKKDTDAGTALVTDSGGNILAYVADEDDESLQTVAALVAGSFSATRELASLIGEQEFHAIFHQGEKTSIFIRCIASTFLLLVVLGPETTEGLVRLYSEKVAKQLLPLLVETRRETGPLSLEIDNDADVF
ncbi:MAG: roadblock/LC7 domain-containing protein [Kiritimatiellia bacterium]